MDFFGGFDFDLHVPCFSVKTFYLGVDQTIVMGFFDRNDDDEQVEEVTLSVPDEDEEEGRLKDEAEARLTGDSSSESSNSDDTSGMLPGMGSSSSSTGSSGKSSSRSRSSGKKESVSLEDIHRQNKQIKSILKDIRSEIKDEGDMNGVL